MEDLVVITFWFFNLHFVLEKIKMLFTSLGRSVLEKTVTSVLVLKSSGTVFPNTDLPADE